MTLPMNPLERRWPNPGVDLRSGQLGMPQQVLNRSKVSTALQEMGREGVSQGMPAHGKR